VRTEQLAALAELSAVVAHEVRNPLAILGNAVASLRRSTLTEADRGTLLDILEEENTRLNGLVSDLLCFGRPVRVKREEICLRDVVDAALESVDRSAVALEVEEPVRVGHLWGDATLLRRAVESLLTNAVQAMNGGGTLSIVLLEAIESGVTGVRLTVRDSGEGMDTGVRKRAKDPFFTTRPSGMGLGLAIVERIMSAHGGLVRIESKAGEGTSVHVFLPANGEPTSVHQAENAGRDEHIGAPRLPGTAQEPASSEIVRRVAGGRARR
jgi:signal transduction histidine kinase